MKIASVERKRTSLHSIKPTGAGLTLQLAADVLTSTVTTSWDEGRCLAAIAEIRILLNFFSNAI